MKLGKGGMNSGRTGLSCGRWAVKKGSDSRYYRRQMDAATSGGDAGDDGGGDDGDDGGGETRGGDGDDGGEASGGSGATTGGGDASGGSMAAPLRGKRRRAKGTKTHSRRDADLRARGPSLCRPRLGTSGT